MSGRVLGHQRRPGADGGPEPVPGGLLQLWDVLHNGYWHARSLDYIGSERSHLLEWMRMPGDVVFIVFGAVPLVIASVKAYLGVRAVFDGK
jgi:nitric oxide reductase subunit B